VSLSEVFGSGSTKGSAATSGKTKPERPWGVLVLPVAVSRSAILPNDGSAQPPVPVALGPGNQQASENGARVAPSRV